jgi:TonB family protein
VTSSALTVLMLTTATQGTPAAGQDWAWDHDAPGCTLIQTSDEGATTVMLATTPANVETTVTISRRKIDSRSGTYPKATLTFDPGGPVVVDAYVNRDDKGNQRVAAVTNDQAFMAKLAGATSIQISDPKMGWVRVPIRSPASAVESARRCEDAKMRGWGIDPAAWRSLKSRPQPLNSPSDWLDPYDYPREALAYDIRGDVIIRLDIRPDGKVGECRSLKPSEYRGFERASCGGITERARFQAAVDASGHPVSAPYVIVISFKIR